MPDYSHEERMASGSSAHRDDLHQSGDVIDGIALLTNRGAQWVVNAGRARSQEHGTVARLT